VPRESLMLRSLAATREENIYRKFRRRSSRRPVGIVTYHQFTTRVSREEPPIAIRADVKLIHGGSCHRFDLWTAIELAKELF
jgi:hypothetical protein